MLLVGVQRFYPVQAERGGGGCRPLYPKFSAPPAGPLQAAEATFPDMAYITGQGHTGVP